MNVCPRKINRRRSHSAWGDGLRWAYLGASSSWQYYVTVDECNEDIARLSGRKLRERTGCPRLASS